MRKRAGTHTMSDQGPSSGADSSAEPLTAPHTTTSEQSDRRQRTRECEPEEKEQFREWQVKGRGLFKELRSSQDDLPV